MIKKTYQKLHKTLEICNTVKIDDLFLDTGEMQQVIEDAQRIVRTWDRDLYLQNTEIVDDVHMFLEFTKNALFTKHDLQNLEMIAQKMGIDCLSKLRKYS